MIRIKQKYLPIAAAVMMIASIAASCTHNNGDIGVWFGLWKLERLTIDGKNDKDYTGNIFFEFQNTTLGQLMMHDGHNYTQMIGEWHESDNQLTITFPDPRYWPVDGYLKGENTPNHLAVTHIDGSHINLTLVTESGSTVVYYLTKW